MVYSLGRVKEDRGKLSTAIWIMLRTSFIGAIKD